MASEIGGPGEEHDIVRDEVTSRVHLTESEAAQAVEPAGRFRIYLGSVAGVGKTSAMLDEGRRRRERGTDAVIGFVECHGRFYTEERIGDLETVPRRVVEYRGSRFEELDLDAVLARHPKLVLIDELAHTNVPGSGRHAKRWEDVLEILDAGIDVISTLNIQHLESIADAVEQMTDTPVRERVPDWVVAEADQIELVDSSPAQLRRRMLHGNIYPPDKVPQALSHFFRSDNLIALRELALRYLADETEEELIAQLRRRQQAVLWETSERFMVGVAGVPGFEVVLRRAARLASRSKGELHAVHVVDGDARSASDDGPLSALRKVAIDVGATWAEVHGDDIARSLMEYARHEQITQIALGASRRSRLRELLSGGSVVWKVQRLAADESVDLHIIARSFMPLELDEAAGRLAD